MGVLVVLLALVTAAPAQATITSVQPWKDETEPISGETISDDAELWAHVQSPSGGVICVHPASPAPAGCDGTTWGKTPVGPFFSGWVPITSQKLPPGEWMLVATENGGAPITATSETFTVEPCPDCPPEAYSKSFGFAAAASTMLSSIKSICRLTTAAGLLWKSKEIYQTAWVTFAAGYGTGAAWASIVGTTAVGVGKATFKAAGAVTSAIPGSLSYVSKGICLAVGGIPFVESTSAAHWAERWANDPPDPNYTELPEPDVLDESQMTGVPEDGYADERAQMDRLRAYARATLVGFERFQGAGAADSAVYEHAQSRVLGDNLFGYAHELRQTADTLAAAAGEMRNQFPDAADRTVTQADLDTADAFAERLRTTGFLAEEVDELRMLGLSDDGIARLRDDLTTWQLSDQAADALVDGAFDDLAVAMRAQAEEAEGMGIDAAVYAGRSNQLPLAGFGAGAGSGEGQLTVAFTDTSSSPDLDPVTIEWDFGDGTTATSVAGAGPEHTYATAGTYVVTQTVRDRYSSTHESQQVTAGPPNAAPGASFTATPQVGAAPMEVSFDGSASNDPDGTIASYEWAFGDGTSGSGVAASHIYNATGTYTAKLTVTDDHGATATAEKTITVAAPAQPPVAADDHVTVRRTGVIDVLGNDTDANGETLTVVATGAAQHGTVSCTALGGCLYTMTPGTTATSDSFTYTVRDAEGLEAGGTVEVVLEVPSPPGPPVAVTDRLETRQGTAAAVNVLVNDGGAGLTVTAAGKPPHGSVACTAGGTCTYTPDPGFSGNDGFVYTISDGEGQTDDGEVHVAVAPAGAGFGISVEGAPDPVHSGGEVSWRAGASPQPAGVAGDELPGSPEVTTELSGAHSIKPGSLRTAPGWTAHGAGGAKAGPGALLGEALSQALPKPLPPTSQGTGGDGHVPILVGTRVYAFFHHQWPTQVTCLDRATGSRCPGYPIALNVGASSIIGPGAVVGSRIYVHPEPSVSYAQSAPVSLFCWDTDKAQSCGLIIVARRAAASDPGGSAPVSIGGKLYFAADGGRLYCVDPATHAPCATPSLPTGLHGADKGAYDIVSHGTRVYVSRYDDKVACIDVAAARPCAGWTLPKPLPSPTHWNLVNAYSAAGVADGVCLVLSTAVCRRDSAPDAPTTHAAWPEVENYNSVTAEAETGTRTLAGSLNGAGLACWDWPTMAPCTGGGYDASGWLRQDGEGAALPTAYGAAWDGACVVAVGDPGLVFTADPVGKAPCIGLGGATSHTVDLRRQRCDGTLGGASFRQVALQDAAAGELSSVTVKVRDAVTGDILAASDIAAGPLDLSGIDAKAHPSITVEASATSVKDDPAWADAVPPRIRVTWNADPRQLCFETDVAPQCAEPFAPVGVTTRLGQASHERRLTVQKASSCVDPVQTVDPVRTVEPDRGVVPDRKDLLLGCTDRRVVLEDVYPEGKRVRLIGVAADALAGRRAEIVFSATGKVVARATVGPDGAFSTSAPLPPRRLRSSNRARYLARVGSEESLNLKLARRMLVTRLSAADGRVTIAGRVIGPLAPKPRDRAITLQRIVACSKVERVGVFRTRRDGSFSITVAAPQGARAAVYRLLTKVRRSARSKRLANTFTLPRAIDF